MKNSRNGRKQMLAKKGVETEKFLSLQFGDRNYCIKGEDRITIQRVLQKFDATDMAAEKEVRVIEDKAIETEKKVEENSVVKAIMSDGYTFNSKTDGRFITAKTLTLLYSNESNSFSSAYWRENLVELHKTKYMFTVMRDELTKREKIRKNRDVEAERLSNMFFSDELIASVIKRYINKLSKSKKRFDKKLQDVAEKSINCMVHFLERGNLLECVVYIINSIELHKEFQTTYALDSDWLDTYKAKGAYFTLLNLVKFHGIVIDNGCDRDESLATIEEWLVEYAKDNELWRLQGDLVYALNLAANRDALAAVLELLKIK